MRNVTPYPDAAWYIEDVQRFQEQLNAGTESALQQLFQQYRTPLIALVKRTLGPHLHADPDRLALSVLRTASERFRNGELPAAEGRGWQEALARIATDLVTLLFLEKLNSATDSGLAEMYQRYARDLRVWIGRKQGRAMTDASESIVMSALGSAIRGFRDGRFRTEDSRRLWNLLVTITVHKLYQRPRASAAVPPDTGFPPDDEFLPGGDSPPDPSPGPLMRVIMDDLIEAILADLDQDCRPVLIMLLEDYYQTEIADRLGLARAAVRTRVLWLQKRAQRLLAPFTTSAPPGEQPTEDPSTERFVITRKRV